MTGSIQKVIADRGFCFIKPDVPEGQGRDVFAHLTGFREFVELSDAMLFRRVEFNVVEDRGRTRADDVVFI